MKPMSVSGALIVDTATLYFRAYHGLPRSLVNAAGEPVNALHGLLDMLANLLTGYPPAELVCAWDDDWRPAWRVALIDSYKAHRLAGEAGEPLDDELARQVPWIRASLAAAGICVAAAAGFEADDVVATLAERYLDRGLPVIVVSGDRDLFQVVRPGIRVAYIARGVANHVLVDDAWLTARYRISGGQYVDFAVLRGDPSDGLPGVAGIGEQTAAGLLASYGDLAGIQAAAKNPQTRLTPRVRAALLANADYLARAVQVVRAAKVPLGELDARVEAGRADLDRCRELAVDYSIRGPMRRLLAALGEAVG